MFNSLPFNGGTLDGARYARVILASAVILGGADAAATAILVTPGSAACSASGVVTATAYTDAYAIADISGGAEVVPISTLVQAASAAASANADVVAFILRYVAAEAAISGNCTFNGIPAAALGQSVLSGGASVTADANRVQHAFAASAGAGAINAIDSVVYRFVVAGISGSGVVQADAGINGVYRGLVSIEGGASININADAVTLTKIAADLAGGGEVTAAANVSYSASAALAGSGGLLGDATRYAYASADMSASASLLPTGVRYVSGAAASDAACNVTAPGNVVHAGSAAIAPGGFVVVDATLAQQGLTAAVGNSNATAIGAAYIPGAAQFSGSFDLVAIAITNADAADPPERTMYRPAVDRLMYRPFIDRVMVATR